MEEERVDVLALVKWELFAFDPEELSDEDAALPSHEWLGLMELRLGFGLSAKLYP